MNNLKLEIPAKPVGLLNEFKEFAMRGNVVDLAIGVIIGAAFGKIVTSLVTDIITPIIGVITPGGTDFKDKFISLQPGKMDGIQSLADAKKAGVAVITYGQFISTIVDFIIVAFCIFIMVKMINRVKNAAPPPAPEPTAEEKLLTEIRDLLKSRN